MKIMNVVRKYSGGLRNTGFALAVALAPAVSFAQVDVSATVTEIGLAKTAAMAIGAAVLAVAVGIMLYKWVRRAL